MKQIRSRWILLLPSLTALTASCRATTEPTAGPLPNDVVQFVSPLPKLRSATTVFEFPEKGFLLFNATYGDPQDCPAGCFYSQAWGIKYAGQIGWIDGAPAGQPQYDVKPTDQFLFDDVLWSRIQKEWIGGYFRIMLSCDFDSPPDALERLATRLPEDGWPFLADLLVDVAQRRDARRVAEIISQLGASTYDYSHSRAHAAAALASWPAQPAAGYCPA
jgi:hypothetical protein